MRSMTGFGRAELKRDGLHISAEVRTLNQRFLELKLSLPRGWGEFESELRKIVQEKISRGRVEVVIRRQNVKPRPNKLVVDQELAQSYVGELRRLGKKLRLDGDLRIEAIVQRQEIFQLIEVEEDTRPEFRPALEALKKALVAVDNDRVREGKGLKADLNGHLKFVLRAVDKITRLSEESRAEILEAFQMRMKELLRELPIDDKRLYDEAAGAASRSDISEELARLRTHLKGMGELFERNGMVGKEIEFLLQEINREVNTIGSKSQNAVLSRVAVDIKGALEKMREQVQNVE